jgi:DNA-directed RNA polymerase specialized sigma24 family protein
VKRGGVLKEVSSSIAAGNVQFRSRDTEIVDHQALEAAHEQLLAGDAIAPSRIVRLVLPALCAFVESAVPAILDHQDVEEACLDVLLSYLANPEAFDSSKAKLFTWLAGNARWRALTKLRGVKRRDRRENIVIQRVQDEALVVDKSVEERAFDVIEVKEVLSSHGKTLFEEDGDVDVFLLIAAGAREVEHYLEVLGLEDTAANRMNANSRRERIRGRLRRLRESLDEK